MNNIQQMLNQYGNQRIGEQTKIREILQQTALLGLERHGFFEKAAFYGGTALRILYGLDRFSEDMDFSLLHPNPHFDFSPFLEGMRKELLGFGFNMEVTTKAKTIETSIRSAFMKINTIELFLAIGEKRKGIHNEKIQIKLEVDIDPPIATRYENQLVLNPVAFYILTFHKSDLFAGKISAILFRAWKNRVKGRDWYDLIWYVQNRIPLNLSYLEACMKQAGHLQPKDSINQSQLIEMLETKIHSINWENAKQDMHAFISDPERLNIWSSQFFSKLIQQIQIEDSSKDYTQMNSKIGVIAKPAPKQPL